MSNNTAADVAAASAAYLYNVLPEILTLGTAEQFRRFEEMFATAIAASREFRGRRWWEPSEN